MHFFMVLTWQTKTVYSCKIQVTALEVGHNATIEKAGDKGGAKDAKHLPRLRSGAFDSEHKEQHINDGQVVSGQPDALGLCIWTRHNLLAQRPV